MKNFVSIFAIFLVVISLVVANDGDAYLYEIEFPDEDTELEVVSVVVTMFDGYSYDNLFRKVKQNLPVGRVKLFRLESHGISDLIDRMSSLPIKKRVVEEDFPTEEIDSENRRRNDLTELEEIDEDSIVGDLEDNLTLEDEPKKRKKSSSPVEIAVDPEVLINEILKLDPDTILFNWECCGGCSEAHFHNPRTIEFLELVLKRGHTTMFSDFAVKALIKEWDEKRLGPNPFVQLGTCDYHLELFYDCRNLRESDIPQLEAVGHICSEDFGKCDINAMSGTIVMGIDHEKLSKFKNELPYELNVLTIVTDLDRDEVTNRDYEEKYLSRIQNGSDIIIGTIGHASLEFSENYGQIIVSAGHWIALSRLDATIESMYGYSKSSYGKMYDAEFDEVLKAEGEEKELLMERLNSVFIQQVPSVRNQALKKTKYVESMESENDEVDEL